MPRDVSLSDSKCWNSGQKWVLNTNLGVGVEAPNEVRLGVHQGPEQIVQARVEVLREGGHGFVPCLPGRGERLHKFYLKKQTEIT